MTEPEGVRQVREWRREVAEEWRGKSDEEILKDLAATRQLYEKQAHREEDKASRHSV